jgi:hypothetical protein
MKVISQLNGDDPPRSLLPPVIPSPTNAIFSKKCRSASAKVILQHFYTTTGNIYFLGRKGMLVMELVGIFAISELNYEGH